MWPVRFHTFQVCAALRGVNNEKDDDCVAVTSDK